MEPIICIGCGQPALAKCKTEAGRREVAISKLCEPCFFEWGSVVQEEAEPEETNHGK